MLQYGLVRGNPQKLAIEVCGPIMGPWSNSTDNFTSLIGVEMQELEEVEVKILFLFKWSHRSSWLCWQLIL